LQLDHVENEQAKDTRVIWKVSVHLADLYLERKGYKRNKLGSEARPVTAYPSDSTDTPTQTRIASDLDRCSRVVLWANTR
jgi:hypothetical protein